MSHEHDDPPGTIRVPPGTVVILDPTLRRSKEESKEAIREEFARNDPARPNSRLPSTQNVGEPAVLEPQANEPPFPTV